MRTSFDGEGWRGLYVAALFEAESAKLPDRIAEAEKALVVRARELFVATGDHIEEKQALDETMYALRAFRNARHCGLSPTIKRAVSFGD